MRESIADALRQRNSGEGSEQLTDSVYPPAPQTGITNKCRLFLWLLGKLSGSIIFSFGLIGIRDKSPDGLSGHGRLTSAWNLTKEP